MAEQVIKVENLGKKYNLGTKEHSFSIQESFLNIFKKRKPPKTFWALKDINFEVKGGEVLGIIGPNGAGKSTLLKILSQITPPTTGKITINGRIASLLEVGTGFHPEFTGRENIYLNGAILGMSHKEIKNKFDEIVAFSEIGKFIDTPVKRYSSGMYVRLAFAVAAHLEPEILIVDEVLSVGDAQFQKKCLGKMQDVAKGGRTVLFVSHNMGAVRQLCNSCLLLQKGLIIARGQPGEIINKYLGDQIVKAPIFTQKHDPQKKMNLRKVILNPDKEMDSNSVFYDEDIIIRIEYEVNTSISSSIVWIALQVMDGTMVFCTADYDLHSELRGRRPPGYYQTEVLIPKKWLNTNTYIVIAGINTNDTTVKVFDRVETIKFNVVDNGTTPKSLFNESSRTGFLQPFLDWKTTKLK